MISSLIFLKFIVFVLLKCLVQDHRRATISAVVHLRVGLQESRKQHLYSRYNAEEKALRSSHPDSIALRLIDEIAQLCTQEKTRVVRASCQETAQFLQYQGMQ